MSEDPGVGLNASQVTLRPGLPRNGEEGKGEGGISTKQAPCRTLERAGVAKAV